MKPVIVILAAGLGTRMKSRLAKVLHPVAGRPMVQHVLKAAADTGPEKTVLVLGHQAEDVKKAVDGFPVETVIQAEQLGTGHAVSQAVGAIGTSNGPVMVLCGDTPLLTGRTLQDILAAHLKTKATVTLLTAVVDDPTGYGRVVRTRTGVSRIVEEKDAAAAQKRIREVNAGIYCFDRKFLLAALALLGRNNAQGEYYLPDLIGIARKKKLRVSALQCADAAEIMGINSRYELSMAESVMRQRINQQWMQAGVTMLDPASVLIGDEVTLGRDVVLYPNVQLEGKTAVGEGTVIHSGCRVTDCTIGENATLHDYCILEASEVSRGASVGPFARLRPGASIGEKAKIGNFVEVKKSVVGKGSKASHLAYIGDTTIGSNVNIGAGVIVCNYDGYDKHKTVIEDDVFVGSDSQLVAPVTIGRGALVAAGSTITRNVPPDALAISRVRQEVREGFAGRRRQQKQKKH